MTTPLRALVFLAVLFASSAVSRSAHAYAWMIRHGFAECGGCHIDPMGGETLTGMGRVTGQTLLSSDFGGRTPSDAAMFLYGVQEPDDVRLGGSVRVLGIYDFNTNNPRVFPMQMDLYGAVSAGNFVLGASFGLSKASARYEHSSKAKLVGNIEDEGYILVSRNHWLGYKFTDDLMARLGRINLPFGVRTPDHTLWVRAETQTDRESDQEHGVSVVYSSGRIRGELMGVVGNLQIDSQYLSPGYSGSIEYSLDTNLAVGVSSLVIYARKEPLTTNEEVAKGQRAVLRQAHGLTGRYTPLKELVFLAEADVMKRTGSGLGYVGMLNADFEPLRGLHLALTGEVLNRGKLDAEPLDGDDRIVEGPGRGETRLGLWSTINWFLLPHLDLRIDLVTRQGRPAMLQSQLHFYL
ncbi:MAG TPA: hypothetical protein VJU61_09585 [Polyangiaceae bacterium]|nr:hypothetical protein [Polyangiaceae bacterium]